MAEKGRRGYTKDGYPIVWLKKFSHEECLAKLKQDKVKTGEPVELEKEISIKRGKVAGLKFRVFSADTYNITLEVDGHKTYHSSIEQVALALKNAIERKKVQDFGEKGITSLNELTDTFIAANREFEECWK